MSQTATDATDARIAENSTTDDVVRAFMRIPEVANAYDDGVDDVLNVTLNGAVPAQVFDVAENAGLRVCDQKPFLRGITLKFTEADR